MEKVENRALGINQTKTKNKYRETRNGTCNNSGTPSKDQT
jgi:hypothetical protein